MNIWLTVRTFIAIFLTAFGVGVIFVQTQHEMMMLGAALFALGVTFLLRMNIEFRRI